MCFAKLEKDTKANVFLKEAVYNEKHYQNTKLLNIKILNKKSLNLTTNSIFFSK